jgi:predicted alpha/beta superfamily hydrolase
MSSGKGGAVHNCNVSSKNKLSEKATSMNRTLNRLSSNLLNLPVFLVLLFAVLFVEPLPAQPSRVDSMLFPPPVEIGGTQSLHFTSSIVGQEFNLYVNIPRDYQDTSKSFPVIYLLDGQWDFPLMNAIFGEQYYDGFVPGAIVVGIAWGGKDPNYDFLRARDLTPTATKQAPMGGNASKFLGFIKKELVPLIDTRYRTKKDDRTLMGSSLGGLFTLYALFQETTLFDRYVLTSPALGWDDGVIETYAKNYAPSKSQLPVRLFMAVGGLEGNETAFEKFADRLKAKKLERLEIETRVIEGSGHSGGKAEGYARGLQFVFAKPIVAVAPAVLDQYTGTYQVSPEFKIKIACEEGQLVAIAPDSTRLTVLAQSEKDFYLKGQYLFIHFKKDDTGKVIGFQLEQFNGQQFVEKIN